MKTSGRPGKWVVVPTPDWTILTAFRTLRAPLYSNNSLNHTMVKLKQQQSFQRSRMAREGSCPDEPSPDPPDLVLPAADGAFGANIGLCYV